MKPIPARPLSDHETARRALFRRRRRRHRRMALGMALGLVALGVLGGVGMWGGNLGLGWLADHTRLLEVRRVDVRTPRWVPPWEVADLSGVAPGDDMTAVVSDSVVARLVRHPRIASARVTRGWDRTVHIEVVETPPVALLHGGDMVEVAEDGTILGPPPAGSRPEWPQRRPPVLGSRGVDLPLLTGVSARQPEPGARLTHEGARQALSFLGRLRQYGRPGETWISEVWAGKPGELLLVTLEEGMPVRIGDGRLTPRKVEALWAVLERIRTEADGKEGTEDEGPVVQVDARFRNQVVVKRS